MWRDLVHAANWFCLRGEGYEFWSGIGSGSPLLAAIYLGYRHHTCHMSRCIRPAWHPHPDHGHPVCKHHFPGKDKP